MLPANWYPGAGRVNGRSRRKRGGRRRAKAPNETEVVQPKPFRLAPVRPRLSRALAARVGIGQLEEPTECHDLICCW
eukprot:6541607-Prymnesium_polylepis.1